ncbi:MAG: hypothetical protein J0H55_11480 [Chitinophagaceae bacterium]|nr:hypothetical protein [Chitinophagaceae bacterium]
MSGEEQGKIFVTPKSRPLVGKTYNLPDRWSGCSIQLSYGAISPFLLKGA